MEVLRLAVAALHPAERDVLDREARIREQRQRFDAVRQVDEVLHWRAAML
jgi:hypothetical protein